MRKTRVESSGFTLLEIMVVLFLVSLVAILVLPKLSLRHGAKLPALARRLSGEIRTLQWEAISRQRMLRLDYDLDRGAFSASILAPSGTLSPFETTGVHPFRLSSPLRIRRIRVLHQGKVTDGKTFTQFFPTGSVEPTTIVLDDGDRRMTVILHGITGRIEVVDGETSPTLPPPFYGPPSGEIPTMESGDE
ncbi:MAG: prepilin-type N-terminal cleavage/methylation domain-containing protein [Nitrospirae bacterium]|nr:prepilin-type N-terminal cleavage/methylation domain-containing protein [Nitrospirota bacterium]